MSAVTPGSARVTAVANPRSHRNARRCCIEIGIGSTKVDGIIDTGAGGGNCIDRAVFNAIPLEKYRIVSFQPSVCIGINKTPVRVLGKIMLDFNLTSTTGETKVYRDIFNVIENLIHPVVIGLPFLQQNRATLSFSNCTLLIGNQDYPMARSPGTPSPPPPHLAAFEQNIIPPMSRAFINVYLTGDQSQIDMSSATSLYVRPFYAETAKEVPQIAAHCIVDPRKKIMAVEVINAWPAPIKIEVDSPIAIVDTVNPLVKNIPQPNLNAKTGEKVVEGDVAAWWNWEGMEEEENEAIPMPSPFSAPTPKTDPPPVVVHEKPPTEVPKYVPMETMEEYPEDEAFPINNFPAGDDRDDVILEEVNPDPPDDFSPCDEPAADVCTDPPVEEGKADELLDRQLLSPLLP